MRMKAGVAACQVSLMLICASTLLASEDPQSGAMPPVVTTGWLAEHLDDPDLVVVQVEQLGRHGLFAGKGQQLPGEVGRPLGRLLDICQGSMGRIRRTDPVEYSGSDAHHHESRNESADEPPE